MKSVVVVFLIAHSLVAAAQDPADLLLKIGPRLLSAVRQGRNCCGAGRAGPSTQRENMMGFGIV
jgi:hypothetical protein